MLERKKEGRKEGKRKRKEKISFGSFKVLYEKIDLIVDK